MLNGKSTIIKIFLIITLVFSIGDISFAWSPPSANPPLVDADGPINSSTTNQSKGIGALGALLNLMGDVIAQGLYVPTNNAVLVGLKVDSLAHSDPGKKPICINAQKKLILCGASPSGNALLNVLLNGSGTGVVFSDDLPRTIACQTGSSVNCFHTYTDSRTLTLTAGNTLGVFAGWGGDCASSGMNQTCVLQMNIDHNVSARFDPPGSCSVTTAAVNNITTTTALSGGTITYDGGGVMSAGGIEYLNVSTGVTKTAGGYTGSPTYVSVMSNLTANTAYRVRAYAINENGTCKGDWIDFSTLGANALPSVTSPTAINVTTSSALLGANVTSLGFPSMSEKGTCYSTLADPRGANCLAASGTGLGVFTHTRSGLAGNTTYYYVGYAKNTQGTAYTDISTFNTLSSNNLPTVTNPQASNITSNSVILSANITSAGIPATITQRGFCYGTQPAPRSNCQVEGGTATGIFSKAITGLSASTLYYFAGYAKNSTGTGYTTDATFTTTSGGLGAVTVLTFSATEVGQSSAMGHGTVTSNGATVTEKGLVWGQSIGPRTWDNCVGGVCNKFLAGSGVGVVNGLMKKDMPWSSPSSLWPGAKYYVRAYAIVPGMTFQDPLHPNEPGSDHLYGNQVEFRTTLPMCASGSFSKDTYGAFTFETSSIPGFPYCVFDKLTFSILGAGGGGGGAAGSSGEPFVLQGPGGGGGGQGGSLTFEVSVSNPNINKTFSGQVGKGGSGGNGGESGIHSGVGGSSGTSTTLVMPEGISLSVAGGAYGNAGHWNCVGGSFCVGVPGAASAGGVVTGLPSIPNVIPGSVSFSNGSNGFSGVLDEIDCSGDGGHGGGNALGGAGGVSGGQKNGYSCGSAQGYGGDGGGSATGNSGGGGGGGGGLGGRWWNFFTFSWIPVPHSGGPGGAGKDGKILITW